MKKGIFTFAIMAIAVLTMSSCKVVLKNQRSGNGDKKEKTYNVGKFSEINNESYADIHFVHSDTLEVKAVGTEKDLAKTKISVDNGTLIISSNDDDNDENTIKIMGSNSGNRLDVYIKAPTLTAVTLNGSGNFVSRDELKTSQLRLTTNGSGDFAFTDIHCNGEFNTILHGSGDISMHKIYAKKANFQSSGSGDIAGFMENVPSIGVSSSGSGDISLICINCGDITGDSNGSGDVKIQGRAKSCNISSNGSGDVITTISK